MTRHQSRLTTGRPVVTVLAALGVLAGAVLTGAAPAGAAQRSVRIARGVTYRQFDITAAKGVTHAHVLSVDLRDRHVRLDLLHPGVVAARAPVSRLAASMGAVAGVNGDFFNIGERQHPGVEATGAGVGPAIAHGQVLKAAVPDGQRFGPALPPGTHTTDVFGVGMDGRARLDQLTLLGSVRADGRRLPLGGLNQYALPVGSVGAFTSHWGSASRARATCGEDSERAAPCSGNTYEVTVRRGHVVSVARAPGSGRIAPGTTVLVGREAGARWLRKLSKGERVDVRNRLVPATSEVAYRFALGGFPVLRDGRPLPGLNNAVSTVRTAVGFTADGRRLMLLALDGAPSYRSGLTVAELAARMRELGAADAFNLDGGGSSTLVARMPGARTVAVRNHPSAGAERPVPNGIGIFSTP